MGRYLNYPGTAGEYVPNASTSTDGFMSAPDKAKLDGIPAGGGGPSYAFLALYGSTTAGNGAGARTCPGALVGDTVQSVWGIDDGTFTPIDPPVAYAANFEGTITVVNQIQQLSGSLSGIHMFVMLRRAVT